MLGSNRQNSAYSTSLQINSELALVSFCCLASSERTVDAFERKLAALEGAQACVATASGMAAISLPINIFCC
jgi:cystathionine beta-lyase/cystathionine gamma-synthase